MKARRSLAVLGIVILVVGVSMATTSYRLRRQETGPMAPAARETAFDRVMRTGTIRCGYTLYSVGLFKDPNSGELHGIYKDLIEEVATRLDLKVVWAEEVAWGAQIEGLNSGRYDMICSPVSITAPRTKAADYTIPLYYSPVDAWVRKDDTRFTAVGQLNDPAVKVATIDGEQTQAVAKAYFPKAQEVSLPQSAEFSQLLLGVSGGKADVTFAEPFVVREFMAHNGEGLKNLTPDQPLELVANIFLIPHGEFEFKALLDNMLTELLLNGYVNQTIDKYETYKGSYVRAKGYQ